MIKRIVNWFKKDDKVTASNELNRFLKTKDLDDLLKINSSIKEIGEKDEEVIKNILKDWKDKQAVSNLLFYPRLIPQGLKESILMKGLNEQKNIYFNLASIVGLQSIKEFSTSENTEKMKNKLFQFTCPARY